MSDEKYCDNCIWWKGHEWESGACGWIEAQPVFNQAIPEAAKQRSRFEGMDCPTWQPKQRDAGLEWPEDRGD